MRTINKKGFTLIELLIVIGIISILAGIVLVAVNPAQQFGKANDSERKSEIGTILSAVYQFQTSPTARGQLPQCTLVGTGVAAIPDCDTNASGSDIANGASGFEGAYQLGTGTGNYDCSVTGALVPDYLNSVPFDPNNTYDAEDTGYYICQQEDATTHVKRVYVIAPYAEVYTTDGGCDNGAVVGATLAAAMCVSG